MIRLRWLGMNIWLNLINRTIQKWKKEGGKCDNRCTKSMESYSSVIVSSILAEFHRRTGRLGGWGSGVAGGCRLFSFFIRILFFGGMFILLLYNLDLRKARSSLLNMTIIQVILWSAGRGGGQMGHAPCSPPPPLPWQMSFDSIVFIICKWLCPDDHAGNKVMIDRWSVAFLSTYLLSIMCFQYGGEGYIYIKGT